MILLHLKVPAYAAVKLAKAIEDGLFADEGVIGFEIPTQDPVPLLEQGPTADSIAINNQDERSE